MTVRQLIAALGGPSHVAALLEVSAKSVSMWGSRDSVPRDYLLPLLTLARGNKLNWQPPGSERCAIVAKDAA